MRALWGVFSDNHEVLAPDGRVVDIGSFRGAAGFISEFFHAGPTASQESIVDRGILHGIRLCGKPRLFTPVYNYIFRLLKGHRCAELLKDPPKTVLAYREIFHRDPAGWCKG